jgi:hypothetical protein
MERQYDSGWQLAFVRVYDEWYDPNWSDDHDDNRAIVVIAGCNSASGSIAANCGGRVSFGYDGTPETNDDITDDMHYLFARMSGVSGVDLRTSNAAWNAGGFSTHFDIVADDNTTLCPAVTSWGPKGSGAGNSGTGFVQLDTVCEETENPLRKEVKSGALSIYDQEWATDSKITFSYCNQAPEYGYTVEVTAKADCIYSECPGGKVLDGNTNPSGENGRAPCWDSFVWTFSK